MPFNFQIHKYKNGHQLVASTINLDRTDQDTIDRLSDISGQLRPGETFEPYFTCYPMPSEKYFIIARTWQDLTAPRAGCVLTKSIIIHINEWEGSKQVYSLFIALKKTEFDLTFPNIQALVDPYLFDSIFDAPVEELVEALFLEQRKPILLFDCHEAEQIIIRLYTVLWPTMKNRFASCTLALAPRSVSSRPFDLLFTDNKVKTRFSDWNGRRIQGEISKKKNGRHRWTKELTDRIFKNGDPTLYDKSNDSLFDITDINDESELRLNLLWEELLSKAKHESSPIAILGLLDIINSQPIFAETLYKNLDIYISSAVKSVLAIEPMDAWKFYAGLLVKHKRKLMGRELLLQVKLACKALTLANPATSIDFISGFNPSSINIPSILYAGIADGLAEFFLRNPLTLIDKISSTLGINFLATSQSYSRTMMFLMENGEKHLSKYIENYLASKNEKALQRAKNNLVHYIKTPAHIRIVYLLLNKASIDQFQHILHIIAVNTHFAFREFDEIIFKTTIKFKAFNDLLNLLSNYSENDNGEQLLVELFEMKPELIEDYLSNPQVSKIKKDNVACRTINQLSYVKLAILGKRKNTAKELIPILFNSQSCKPEKIAEFIFIAEIPIGEALVHFGKLPTTVINSVDPQQLFYFIQKSFNKLKPNSIVPILKKLDQSQSDFLIQMYFDSSIEIKNIKVIFETLLYASENLKKSLARHIDLVSASLAKHLPDNINIEFVDAWINLLLLTNEGDKRRKAAIEMLGYAYEKLVKDPTNLISVSFPIVYDTFLQGKSLTQSIVYWVFSDWDKCRILRYDLAERYLSSDWPALGLFQVAKKAGILKDIIYIVNNSKKGKKFMDSAYDEILKTSQSVDRSIIKHLKKHGKGK